MSDMPYIDATTDLEFQISNKCKEEWRHLVNKHYYGSPSIPLSVKPSDIPQELKDAHWRINSGRMVGVTFRLYADGSAKIISGPKQKE